MNTLHSNEPVIALACCSCHACSCSLFMPQEHLIWEVKQASIGKQESLDAVLLGWSTISQKAVDKTKWQLLQTACYQHEWADRGQLACCLLG